MLQQGDITAVFPTMDLADMIRIEQTALSPHKAVGYLKFTVDQYYLTDYFNTFQYIDTISLQKDVNLCKRAKEH